MKLFEILKEYSNLPTISFNELWHVGTLSPNDKKNNSFEGAGLSVSNDPSSWRRIAKLSGSIWSVNKPHNSFIDAHSLSNEQRSNIIKWGIEKKYIDHQKVYRVNFYDDELGDDYYIEFDNIEDAEKEIFDSDDEIEIIDNGIKMNQILLDKVRSNITSSSAIFDLLLTVFAEEYGYDGVWWEDKLDVTAYSAPRGVIVPAKIKSWNFTKIKD